VSPEVDGGDGHDDGNGRRRRRHPPEARGDRLLAELQQRRDVQKLSAVSSQYDIIAVAFADATSTPGAVSFTLDSSGLGGYTVDQFKAEHRRQARGRQEGRHLDRRPERHDLR